VVLLMGDEPNSVEVLSRLLRRAGYDPDVVWSRQELDLALQRPDIAVVMIDVNDPNSRGLRRLVSAINERHRAEGRTSAIPILVTASDPTAERWAPAELGVDVVLRRPFKEVLLLESLAGLTDASRSIAR
jgi:two-component system, OmpR family, response regulator